MHYEPRIEPTNFKPDMECKGIVFDIQHNTVNNGPGKRTSIFLKGCPLHCSWCSAPESQNPNQEIIVHAAQCDGLEACGKCLDACPLDSNDLFVRSDTDKITAINNALCTNCFACVEACPTECLTVSGKEMTVAQVMEEVLKNLDTIKETGGGVTICGGEAFLQPKFTLELLKACKKKKIHTCVESSLCVDWDAVEEAMDFIDFFITDIKTMDPEQHEALTGGTFELVHNNIQKLARAYRDTYIRLPLIPGYNDSAENISKASVFIDEEFGINLLQVQVLRFHEQGKSTYGALNKNYPLERMQKPDEQAYAASIEQALAIIKEQGLPSASISLQS